MLNILIHLYWHIVKVVALTQWELPKEQNVQRKKKHQCWIMTSHGQWICVPKHFWQMKNRVCTHGCVSNLEKYYPLLSIRILNISLSKQFFLIFINQAWSTGLCEREHTCVGIYHIYITIISSLRRKQNSPFVLTGSVPDKQSPITAYIVEHLATSQPNIPLKRWQT